MRDHWFYIQRWRHNRELREQEEKRKEKKDGNQNKKTAS